MMAAIASKNLMFLISKNYNSVSNFHVSFSPHFSTSRRINQTVNCGSISELLIHKHQFSPESASQLASILNHLRNPQKSDSILSFLRENGFTNSQLEKIVKSRSQLFAADLEKIIRPKIMIFQEHGFSNSDIADIITKDPCVLLHSLNNRIIPALSVLRGLLGSSVEVAKVLKCSTWCFSFDLEKNLIPNIEFMKSYGIPKDHIIKHIYMAPKLFLHKPADMRKFIEKASEMGFDRMSKLFLYAVRYAGPMSDEVWNLKLNAYQNMGFSENDILKLFKTTPSLLVSSEEKIKKTKEFLLESGKYDMSCIVKNPVSLNCSIPNRYIPRLQVLQVLENRNLIKKWPSLGTLATYSDLKFFEKFVAPYISEVGDLFFLKNALSDKRDTTLVQKDA